MATSQETERLDQTGDEGPGPFSRLWRGMAGRLGLSSASADTAAPAGRGVTIRNTARLNPAWKRSEAGHLITVHPHPLITRESRVFAMGSCFAVEIRQALRDRGFDIFPKYGDIEFDPTTQKLGGLPRRDNINHYDTFTIRQEFERAFAPEPPRAEDYWEVQTSTISGQVEPLLKDPHRKLVFARTLDLACDATSKLDACIRDGILRADVYVITLGLTEVWRNRRNGRYICQAPTEKGEEADFELSDFAANLANMRRVCELLRQHFPQKKIILTVSPVPLARTFTGRDVVVANMESKSILRAVAGQIEREFDSVVYWPSFEIAARENVFRDDGRHVSTAGVGKIVSAFVAAHCEVPAAGEDRARPAERAAE